MLDKRKNILYHYAQQMNKHPIAHKIKSNQIGGKIKWISQR